MSISSVTDADYSSVVETIRSHLANGTSLSAQEARLALAVVKNASSRIATAVAALTPLDATACSASFGAPAAAIIAAQVTALGVPSYTTNTVFDGNGSTV